MPAAYLRLCHITDEKLHDYLELLLCGIFRLHEDPVILKTFFHALHVSVLNYNIDIMVFQFCDCSGWKIFWKHEAL